MGDIFVADTRVFGPGFLDAVKLEKNARGPRIVLSTFVRRCLRQASSTRRGREHLSELRDHFVPRSQGEMIRTDYTEFVRVDPGHHKQYIAYLDFVQTEVGGYSDPTRYTCMLAHHKKVVEETLRERPKLWRKLKPVVSYHNTVVEALMADGLRKMCCLRKEDLLISP